MKKRTPSQLWDLMTETITELRGFESRFRTKILTVSHFWKNDLEFEAASESFLPKLLKAELGTYVDDQGTTNMYPYAIKDHLFFIECSNPIPNYQEFILSNLESSKKGFGITKFKLDNPKFVEKAPPEIIDSERKKLEDFGYRWELWTISYLMYDLE